MRQKPINARNAFNAVVIASVATISAACILLAPRYPLPCTLVGIFVSQFATVLRLPVSGHPPDQH